MAAGIGEWVEKKFTKSNKLTLMQRLAPGVWSTELVIGNVKYEAEVDLMRQHGIRVHRLAEIIGELRGGEAVISSASGGDLLELIHLSASARPTAGEGTGNEADIVASRTGDEE